jgi:diguanylate cyclase (GGDEF)-like protein
MSETSRPFDKTLLERALRWFQPEFRRQLVSPIESHFPDYQLPRDIQGVIRITNEMVQDIGAWQGDAFSPSEVGIRLAKANQNWLPLLKQIILQYRRSRAADTESKTEKTFHPELTDTLKREVNHLDILVRENWFQQIATRRLPQLQDFLPVKLVEAATTNLQLSPREYDQKFAILQAPGLFLTDLAFFRAKCESRESLLAIAYLDIDHFKRFNTEYTETRVDRDLLPLFMQTIEAQVYHHGYAYREGGDEVMILVPGLSRTISIAFLDELRCKLAKLEYPDIKGATTVSVGLCIVEANCPLTDRELRDRANQAKKFAKEQGRNCIATYKGPHFLSQELEVVSSRERNSG